MSKKRNSHVRGERGQAFADLIRGIPSEQILCVSLDISKYFHVVMMHNGLGEIVRPAFEIDFYQRGSALLLPGARLPLEGLPSVWQLALAVHTFMRLQVFSFVSYLLSSFGKGLDFLIVSL